MDFVRDGQQLEGYKTLNLNNSFEDASFMREVFYYHLLRNHAPAAKANFVRLYINDQDWGIYQNVQQLNKDFLKEWWVSNDGSNFRADSPTSTFGVDQVEAEALNGVMVLQHSIIWEKIQLCIKNTIHSKAQTVPMPGMS